MPNADALRMFELGQQLLGLAGATKPCPGCPACLPEGSQVAISTTCGDGLPLKRVWVFPRETGVRVSCRFIRPNGQHWYAICECQGLGWTAATDGWPEAAVSIGANVFRSWWNRQTQTWWSEVRLVEPHRKSSVAVDHTQGEAEIAALIQAVEAHSAWELMAVPDMSRVGS